MRGFFILIIITIVCATAWVTSRYWMFDKNYYLPEKALELSMPFDVKIDIEFLKSLRTANE